MSKQDILEIFKDINYEYNDSTRFTTLKNMLNEMCEDCDRVAVVRCKDCVYGKPYNQVRVKPRKEYTIWCYKHVDDRTDDWFCADGERKYE